LVATPNSALVFAKGRVQRGNIAALVVAEEFFVAVVAGVTARIAGEKDNGKQKADYGKCG